MSVQPDTVIDKYATNVRLLCWTYKVDSSKPVSRSIKSLAMNMLHSPVMPRISISRGGGVVSSLALHQYMVQMNPIIPNTHVASKYFSVWVPYHILHENKSMNVTRAKQNDTTNHCTNNPLQSSYNYRELQTQLQTNRLVSHKIRKVYLVNLHVLCEDVF